MAKVLVTWHIFADDDKLCDTCRHLDNYTWEIEAGEFTGFLEHPMYGIVSSAEHGSMVKHSRGECRCKLSTEIDWTDTIQILTRIRDRIAISLEQGTHEGDSYK